MIRTAVTASLSARRLHFDAKAESGRAMASASAAVGLPLTGLHARVACQKCHPMLADVKPYAKYAGISFAKCTPCHTDPHKGSFTAPCQSCRTTAGWTRVAQLEGFDHAKTKFPLLGKHERVACSDCHRPPNLETTLKNVDFRAAPTECSGCHTDAHAGQFAARKDAADCSSCHETERWRPALFRLPCR